jgi:hypothetical protein
MMGMRMSETGAFGGVAWQRALGGVVWQRALGALVGPLALGLALVVGLPAAPVGANGTPIRIVLSYLNGISNFGPQNATGVAELVTSEGEVRVTTTGLQRLQGEQYHAWLTTANNAERLWLGAFEANDQGVGRLDRVIPEGIPERDWGLMVLTVEQGAAQPAQPSNRRAIAGRFPSTASAGMRPGQLPNTGGTPTTGTAPGGTAATAGWSGLSTEGLVLLGLLFVGALAFGLRRASGRRGPAMTIGSNATDGATADGELTAIARPDARRDE